MTATPSQNAPDQSGQASGIATAIALLFAVLGVGAVALLGFNIFSNQDITNASSTGAGLLIFLDAFGIIVPLLVIGFSAFALRLSLNLFQRETMAAMWARQVMFWILVFALFGIGISIVQWISEATNPDVAIETNYIGFIIVFAIGGAIAWAIWRWIGNNRLQVYSGEETISGRESLLAWNLLVPTLIILILVAARPLERTFIASLTERTFGGTEEPQFVGLQNYGALLGFRIDTLNCETDDSGTCLAEEVEEEVETTETISVDLASIEGISINSLDVGPDFYTTDAMNQALEESDTFREAMESAALEQLSEEDDFSAESVTAVEFTEPGVLQVEVGDNGETAAVSISQRMSDIEGLDLESVGVGFDDVRLDGLNVYRLRSRALREGLGSFVEQQYNPGESDTLDDVSVNEFVDLNTLSVTLTNIEISEETAFPRPDATFSNYDSYNPLFRVPTGDSQLIFSARDRAFFRAVGNTLFFTFFSVSTELILGMIIAMVVNSNFPGRGLMRAAMLIPWAIPTVVSARLWEVMLRDNNSGVINSFLSSLGIIDSPIAWLANPDFQIWSMIFVDVWKTTPFMALLLLAGLQTIPSDIYEAADVDGAGPIRKFFSMTLPMLRPTIAVALVFRTLDAIRAFDVFQVLLGRQLQSMATYNQFVLVEQQQFGYASAVGVTIFVIILIFTIIYVRALGLETD